jgi:hypothetical protein
MKREHLPRSAALAFLALLAVGDVACGTTVGVGVAIPVQGAWGPRPAGGYSVSGVYVGGPAWP